MDDEQPGSQPQAINPSLYQRKIIHVDMDAFYAAVEVRDHPSLAGKPLIVGGAPERRGVVATCSYEARRFGVRSAMSSRMALQLCPQALILKPNFAKYQQVSQELRGIFARYTDLIEPLSLDEAYLDVTNNKLGLYAVQIAKRIKEEVREELRLTCSAGVGPNKMLAKIASDINKPNGITLVLPEQVLSFMSSLSLRKLPGVGPATEKRLAALNYRRCSDVWLTPLAQLEEELGGRLGGWLYARSRGIDERALTVARVRKSLGRELTFERDILALSELEGHLLALVEDVAVMLVRKKLVGRTLTVKIKYADFELITRSLSLSAPTCKGPLLGEGALTLLRKSAAGQRRVRLLGFSVAKLDSASVLEAWNGEETPGELDFGFSVDEE